MNSSVDYNGVHVRTCRNLKFAFTVGIALLLVRFEAVVPSDRKAKEPLLGRTMNHRLDSRSRSSATSGRKYSQVHQHLLEQVREGVFKVGTPLPKEEELAKSLEVARSTVRRALRGAGVGWPDPACPGKGDVFEFQ